MMTDAALAKDPILPKATVAALRKVAVGQRHAGLQLDKFSDGGSQAENQGPALEVVCQTGGALPAWAIENRRRMLQAVNATMFTATTAGPLTLHLSRASVLENAGICLHPLYGFVYLPGSGLKGMARAWAETTGQSGAQFDRIFGWVPGNGHQDAQAGGVIFHEAWPEKKWPALIRDLVNNHHPKYYQGTEPPGDWMDPIPVSFLAVGPGQAFSFALSPRRAEDAPLVPTALEWLQAALVHRGAGAKTNAGYGAFRLDGTEAPPLLPAAGAQLTAVLELVTPGFFAGARQDSTDCDLRPASLRGQLRWWWRTLHAGHLPVPQLKALEAQLWGDTQRAGMIRVTVAPDESTIRTDLYDKEKVTREAKLPKPAGKTTQGLHYASYGMDETSRGEKRRRHFVRPGARWTVTITARETGLKDDGPTVAQALEQARVALWLLSRHGGVGSKARNGFGCFADLEFEGIASIDDCRAIARQLKSGDPIEQPETPSLDHALLGEWLLDPKQGAWSNADHVGALLRDFASSYKHSEKKLALGLPRQIHGPKRDPMGHQDRATHRPPRWLGGGGNIRHASPQHLHVGRTAAGRPVLRVTAFPARRLPNWQASLTLLKEFMAWCESELRAESDRAAGADAPGPAAPTPKKQAPPERFFKGVRVRHADKGVGTVQSEDRNRGILVKWDSGGPMTHVKREELSKEE